MFEPVDVMDAFNQRVRRHVAEAITRFDRDIGAISAEMAARGLFNSGVNLKRKIELLRISMQRLTDLCFEDVTRLPGNQSMHRVAHEHFLIDQLEIFFKSASETILFPNAPESAAKVVQAQQAEIWSNVHHDMRDFKANLWRPRIHAREGASPVVGATASSTELPPGSGTAGAQVPYVPPQGNAVNFNFGAQPSSSITQSDDLEALKPGTAELGLGSDPPRVELAPIPAPTFRLPNDWTVEKAGIIERLDALELRLIEAKPIVEAADAARRSIGGNYPPWPIDSEYRQPGSVSDVAVGVRAIGELRAQFGLDRPTDTVLVLLSTRAIEAACAAVVRALQWFSKHINEIAAGVIVDAIMNPEHVTTLIQNIQHQGMYIVDLIAALF